MTFCEEGLCQWIQTPSDTWSNLMHIVVGIIILVLTKKEKRWNLYGVGWAVAAFVVGIGSFMFHATQTFWGEFLDITGMFMFSGILVVGSCDRLFRKSDVNLSPVPLYILVVGISSDLLLWQHSWGIFIFIAHVFMFLGFETAIFLKIKPWTKVTFSGGKFEIFETLQYMKVVILSNSKGEEIVTKLVDVKPRQSQMFYQQLPLYRPLWWMFIMFGIAWFFWWLDLLGVWCSPTNHWITGHSMWHYTNAWCFLMAYRFYRYPVRCITL